ncbi:MAG: aminotransferase class IV, partial [Thermoplasmata archaeon]
LRGVTRDTLLRLASDERIPIRKTEFSREELYTADELFYTGTAAGVVPIREVDGRPIGTGHSPVARRLQRLYDAAVRGRGRNHREWLTLVDSARPSPP